MIAAHWSMSPSVVQQQSFVFFCIPSSKPHSFSPLMQNIKQAYRKALLVLHWSKPIIVSNSKVAGSLVNHKNRKTRPPKDKVGLLPHIWHLQACNKNNLANSPPDNWKCFRTHRMFRASWELKKERGKGKWPVQAPENLWKMEGKILQSVKNFFSLPPPHPHYLVSP